jgi:hypothetical protein
MSSEYLAILEPDALSFVTELTYGRHSGAGSLKETDWNLRQLLLRVDADNKFVAAEVSRPGTPSTTTSTPRAPSIGRS